MRKILKVAFLSALSLWGCEPLEQTVPLESETEGELISISVKAAGGRTKSSFQYSETAVSSLNVYAYRGGQLTAESYGEDDEVCVELVRGVSYNLYALANCGEVHAPLRESELQTISIPPSGMVMCNRSGVVVFAGATSSLEMPLTRLYARYNLVLDKNLENCDYEITAVRVRQQAASVRPFAAFSSASSTVDGDYASASDLSALNAGEPAVFYVPENCQGVLLPDNSDPWAKIPGNIPSAKRGLCTYLTVEGNWTTSGAAADLSLNLMLGGDNCSDFNVVRNTSITITLSLSDAGTLRSSWKVDMDNLDDERVLAFPDGGQTVMQEDGWTRLALTVSPADMPFSASFAQSGSPVMEAKVESGAVWVRGLYDGDQRPSRTLTVSSWDGKHNSSTEITLDYSYAPLTDFDYHLPQYPGEYGWFDFPDATASRPVVIEAADWTTSLGPAYAQSIEYHLDSHNGVEYYVLHNLHKLFVRPVREGGQMYYQFTQYKSRVGVFQAPVVNPVLSVGNCVVSESGSLKYSAPGGYYYDSTNYVVLIDENGEDIDVRRFKVPTDLLAYKGKSAVQTDYYSEFLDFYGVPSIQSSDKYGCRVYPWTENYEDFDYTSLLAMIYCYGTADYGSSLPTFPFTATLSLGSGDVLTATGTVTGLQAFPSQRYLGSYYNYQLAPGAMRSMSTEIDFTSGGTYYAPTLNGVSWTVNHADGSDYDIPAIAVDGGMADSYSAGASLSGKTLTFSQMNQTTFPSCGMLGLTGTLTNPHTGRTYTGYYTIGVVLYVPVGCHFDYSFGNRIALTHIPFTEFTVPANRGKWISCFPSGVKLLSEYGNPVDYDMWGDADDGNHEIVLPRFDFDGTLEGLTAVLSGYMSALRFSFKVGSQTYQELLLDHSSDVFFPDDSWSSDGSRGYYHLVRQYDLGTFNHGTKYNGLENYLIEAAYESADLY